MLFTPIQCSGNEEVEDAAVSSLSQLLSPTPPPHHSLPLVEHGDTLGHKPGHTSSHKPGHTSSHSLLHHSQSTATSSSSSSPPHTDQDKPQDAKVLSSSSAAAASRPGDHHPPSYSSFRPSSVYSDAPVVAKPTRSSIALQRRLAEELFEDSVVVEQLAGKKCGAGCESVVKGRKGV